MKILKKRDNYIEAASSNSGFGTTFYRTTADQLAKSFQDNDVNIWMRYMIATYGFDAIKVSEIWGSAIIDNILYLCTTDGQELNVDGNEIDPETALETVGPEKLAAYVTDATPDDLHNIITDQEVNFIDVDDAALKMLQDGCSFAQLVKSADEIQLVSRDS